MILKMFHIWLHLEREGSVSVQRVGPDWKSMAICSHMVAVAESFFVTKKVVNVTKLLTTKVMATKVV